MGNVGSSMREKCNKSKHKFGGVEVCKSEQIFVNPQIENEVSASM